MVKYYKAATIQSWIQFECGASKMTTTNCRYLFYLDKGKARIKWIAWHLWNGTLELAKGLVQFKWMLPCIFSSLVSLDEIDALRLGRQSEGFRKYTEEQVEGRCFSIIFKSRRKNLDLIASSEDEAKRWVNSMEKMISNINNLNCQEKTEQYPLILHRQFILYYGSNLPVVVCPYIKHLVGSSLA